jgi:glutaredoxin 3
MSSVLIYISPWCPYCIRAKALLDEQQIPYDEIDVSGDPQLRQKMLEASGGWTVPQIFIHGKPIGGYDELDALHRRGELEQLLARESEPSTGTND